MKENLFKNIIKKIMLVGVISTTFLFVGCQSSPNISEKLAITPKKLSMNEILNLDFQNKIMKLRENAYKYKIGKRNSYSYTELRLLSAAIYATEEDSKALTLENQLILENKQYNKKMLPLFMRYQENYFKRRLESNKRYSGGGYGFSAKYLAKRRTQIHAGIRNSRNRKMMYNTLLNTPSTDDFIIKYPRPTGIFPTKNNLEECKFKVKTKTGILGKLLYTKNVFPEVKKVTQSLVDLYLEPRSINKVKAPKNITKPKAPLIPKFIKTEFETKVAFQDRVNRTLKTREDNINSLQEKYRRDVEERNKIVTSITDAYLLEVENVKKEQAYKKSILPEKIKEFQAGAFKMVSGGFKFEKRSYDAETGTMYVTMKAKRAKFSKKVSFKIPPSKAQQFAQNIKNIKAKVNFEFANNQITLKSINALDTSGTYLAILDEKDFKPEQMTIVAKVEKVKFDSAKQMRLLLQNPNLKDTYQIEALAYKDGIKIKGAKSSYNDDIPSLLSKSSKANIDKKKWLFIIGIEKYSETDDITFSKRSAIEFKKVAQKTLGIKDRNTEMLLDNEATSGRIKNKLRVMLSEVKKGDTIYFYYNGHGVPDPANNSEPYMLPSDMIPDFITAEKEFALKNIYKQLSNSKASYVVGFVDSCFSGATDGVSIIKGVAASRLAPKKVTFNKKKMAIITAGQKKQYSNMYKEKGHRMFSYYVMKSLIAGKRDINSLYKEVSYKVSEQSNELGALKKQEPTLDGNKNIKL